MATAAASLTGDTSSYTQFQQFVGGMPLGAGAGGGGSSSFSNGASNAHLDNQQGLNMDMAQASRPPGQKQNQNQNSHKEQTSGILSGRPIALDLNQSNSSPSMAELEAAEAASTKALIEGVLGPNKDGRVRNPVPSKLKGKTDNKQGNFGVMHMGVSPGKKSEVQGQGRDAAAERDAAARRTSENTASRAKAAQSEKYVPPKKRGLDASLNPDPRSQSSPFGGSRDTQRSRPLAPDETKSEQARLLTLLRSINPITVVDQICKAVAYFGGIPGAPPPGDGIFPESANTRETGALFIGWLAEIFPDLTPKSPEVSKDQASKKKGRLSKGVKDTPTGDASEAPNSRNGYGYGPAVSAPSWGLVQSLALVNTPVATAAVPMGDPKVQAPEKSLEQPSPETPAKNQVEDSSSKRRRGRPKGSRNKGKDEQPDSEAANTDGQNQAQPAPQSPQIQATAAKAAQPSPALAPTADPIAKSYASSFNTAPAPKPVSINQVQNNQYTNQQWQASNQLGQPGSTSIVPPGDELSPEERAVLEAFRQHPSDGVQQSQQAVPSPTVPPKPTSTQAGQKRKRAPAKPKANAATTPKVPAGNLPPTDHPPILPPGRDVSMGAAKDALQWGSGGSAGTAVATTSTNTANPTTTATTAPPPKRPRQRKPKAPANVDIPPRNQTASVVSTATPPIPPSTIPDSQATASQQSIQQNVPQSNNQSIPQSIQQSIPQTASVTRPAAEGLEAHYNYFQQQQQQQNGRSNPPTMPQQQVQQHARQNSQAQAVTSQQSTPQLQQQNLMQHQKSQQGQQSTQQTSQRDDAQKTAQTSSARPSSTGFYNHGNQPTSATYSQQYPSHQPSQLYGTNTASPQMANSTSNSYRTNSTHAMAQASPQFTQAESNYRTASPHTLGQPSPSFSQTSTNYRNTSSHNLAQHSPAVTQAENSYRAPSSHAIAQPSPAYTTSRSHSQSQPSHHSHYNHFSDSSYIDLPTLESLGHSGGAGSTSVGLANNTYGTTGGFGQGINVGLGNSRTSATSNSVYGSSSGLSNPYDASSNDLLRGVGVSRTANSSGGGAYGSSSNSGSVGYGTSSSRLSNSFDPTSQDDMRDQLMRGSYGRR